MFMIGQISSPLYHFKLNEIIERTANPVEVDPDKKYTQIGIRSHGKGIFIKDEVTGAELGKKRVFWIEPDCFIVNIVFAWERAIARTTSDLEGLIASHRFPMYKVNNLKVDLDYFTRLFLTKKGKMLLELASPGGAGRNKTLGQKEFLNLEIDLPTLEVQKYLSSFLKYVDKKILLQQEKIDLLKEQKKGYMQKIFSQELRFRDDNGNSFPEWKTYKIESLYERSSERNTHLLYNNEQIISVSKMKFKDETKDSNDEYMKTYNILRYGEIAFEGNKSKHFKNGRFVFNNIGDGIVSHVFIVFKPLVKFEPNFIKEYINNEPVMERILLNSTTSTLMMTSLNTKEFLNQLLKLPSIKEQKKIGEFLSKFDLKINLMEEKLRILQSQKQAFMQQMFI